jgi:hypothetical protein
MDAAARFGALERNAEPEEAEEPVDDGQPDPDPEPAEADEPAEDEEGAEVPEDDGEPEDEPAGTKAEPRTEEHEIALPGGSTAKVTLDELKKGYLRDADYRRKTHELGQQRRQLEEAQARVEEVVKKLGPLAPEEQEPDWDAEYEADPIGVAQKYIKWQKRKAEIAAVREEAAKAQQMRVMETERQKQQRLQKEHEALLAIPEFASWKDETKAKAHQQKLRTYAQSIGFADEDLNGVTDHRVLRILEDARRYREIAAKSKTVEKIATPAPKVRKPGPVNDPKTAADERLSQAKKSLARSGSAEDAARALAALNRTR